MITPSQRRKRRISSAASAQRSLRSGAYIGMSSAGPAMTMVSAPSCSAARRLTFSAFSEEDPARVVPPIPTMQGFELISQPLDVLHLADRHGVLAFHVRLEARQIHPGVVLGALPRADRLHRIPQRDGEDGIRVVDVA